MSARVYTVQNDSMEPDFPVGAKVFVDDIDPGQIRPAYTYLIGQTVDDSLRLCRVLGVTPDRVQIGLDKTGETIDVERRDIAFAAIVFGIKQRPDQAGIDWLNRSESKSRA